MQKAFSSIITNIILQIMTALQGFIVSRFVLSTYGSAINGMVNSISQFLIYAGLAEMGIGNAAIIALYKPISNNNWKKINSLISTTKRKYFFSGMFYIMIVLLIALLYPFAIKKQFDYGFVFFMVIVIGGVNLAEYFILAKYKVFLSALQKYYVLNIARSISIFGSLTMSILLMSNNYSLILVKGVIVLIRVCEALIIRYYTTHQYPKLQEKSNLYIKIKQQNNALLHQLDNIVIYNTDLVVLTICLSNNSLYEISVYTVYAMPCNMMINLLNTLTTGMNSTFGDIIVRGDKKRLKSWYDAYEYIYLLIVFSAYTCFVVMIIPFVKCYTVGIYDINYIRLFIGILFCFSGLTAHIKGAAMVLIVGAGHFRETQKYIVLEAIINILISLILVRRYGLIGVLIGTIISHMVADPGYINHAYKVILGKSSDIIQKRIVRNSIIFILLSIVEYNFVKVVENWIVLILVGVIILFINIGIYYVINVFFEPEKKYILKNVYIKVISKKHIGEKK